MSRLEFGVPLGVGHGLCELFTALSYIAVSNSVGEVTGEDPSTELIDFDLPDDLHAGPFQAQLQTADAREEAAYSHPCPPRSVQHPLFS